MVHEGDSLEDLHPLKDLLPLPPPSLSSIALDRNRLKNLELYELILLVDNRYGTARRMIFHQKSAHN